MRGDEFLFLFVKGLTLLLKGNARMYESILYKYFIKRIYFIWKVFLLAR